MDDYILSWIVSLASLHKGAHCAEIEERVLLITGVVEQLHVSLIFEINILELVPIDVRVDVSQSVIQHHLRLVVVELRIA